MHKRHFESNGRFASLSRSNISCSTAFQFFSEVFLHLLAFRKILWFLEIAISRVTPQSDCWEHMQRHSTLSNIGAHGHSASSASTVLVVSPKLNSISQMSQLWSDSARACWVKSRAGYHSKATYRKPIGVRRLTTERVSFNDCGRSILAVGSNAGSGRLDAHAALCGPGGRENMISNMEVQGFSRMSRITQRMNGSRRASSYGTRFSCRDFSATWSFFFFFQILVQEHQQKRSKCGKSSCVWILGCIRNDVSDGVKDCATYQRIDRVLKRTKNSNPNQKQITTAKCSKDQRCRHEVLWLKCRHYLSKCRQQRTAARAA